ncbi:MAG: aldo/keto reductase [Candidatus Riflebacteria bacterium]|nr:aldo/keto reductase [Candidatus Riflebacteria bacterium]
MRLPRTEDGNGIDYATAEKMVARAMEAGLNYFDTAYMYHGGKSQVFVGDVLSKYPRDSFYLANKMPPNSATTIENVEKIFNEQLEVCKTPYFDFYLIHALNNDLWEKHKKIGTYEFLKKKQAEGKIRKLGFSFHDTPDVLQKIVNDKEWEFAQIQLNYLDWELYKSKEQYEILEKAGIPAIIMEPLRGGALSTLNPVACEILKNANPNVSVSSWALRYVGSLPNVLVILSGMTLPEHLEDNIKTFTPFAPLNDKERETLNLALAAYRKSLAVPCTACRYCMPCPFGVDIPTMFGNYNQYKIANNKHQFKRNYAQLGKANADSCMACGLCKTKCPQKLDIPELLKKVAAEAKS